MTTARPALFCTDVVAERHGDTIATAAPQLDVVTLRGKERVADDDLARIEVACLSGDAFPDRTAPFFGACLRMPNLRWFHTFSAGTDDPVFHQIMDAGARLTTSSGAAAPHIARTALLYLLALNRDLPRYLRDQAAHEWAPHSFTDLDGQTVGVVGMGPIGRELVPLCEAVGMRAIGMRRTVTGDEPCETWPLERFAELAASVDVLALALPLADETRGILSAPVIASMRPGAIVLNVGRGELIDEAALTAALVDGHLGGAGLDVFATEPLPPESPLWDLPNVLITPHSSGATDAAHERGTELFLENLAAYTKGAPLRNEVERDR